MTSPRSSPTEHFVTTPDELAAVCEHLAAVQRFGFDTEFIGEGTFHPELCLIQVGTPERLLVIDPFGVGSLERFWQVLVHPDHQVIVHGGREEVRLCKLATGVPPANCFDVQLAAGLVGYPYPLNHAALVGQVLGLGLSKSETLTNWRTRPLTAQQLKYAYDDVRHLLGIWHEINRRLSRMSRLTWAQEEFERFVTANTDEAVPLEKWRKLPGVGNLSARNMAVARALFAWRQKRAEAADRPPRTICRDDLLIEIVRRNPQKTEDLQVVRGLAKRDLDKIMAVVEEARKLPASEWPTVPEREQDPPQLALLIHLLQAVVAHLAFQMKIAPGLICTVQDLRLLTRTVVEGVTRPGASALDQGWRRQHIRPILEDVLRGRQAVRILHPRAAAPLEFLPVPPATADVADLLDEPPEPVA